MSSKDLISLSKITYIVKMIPSLSVWLQKKKKMLALLMASAGFVDWESLPVSFLLMFSPKSGELKAEIIVKLV